MVDGLARILCMRAEVGDQTGPPVPETQTNQEGGHCKKERKKIKAPKMDYNKFQPPVYDFRDGTPSSNRATGGMGSAMAVGGGGGPGTANAGGGGGGGPQQPDYSPLHTQAIESDVKEIKRILRTFINRLNDKDAQGKIAKEWRIVARILDRLFFFMYVCTIVVSLATIFPKGGWRHLHKKFINPYPIFMWYYKAFFISFYEIPAFPKIAGANSVVVGGSRKWIYYAADPLVWLGSDCFRFKWPHEQSEGY